nr:A400 [uncultured bacterium]
MYLGVPYVSFEADPVDPPGQYRVTAVVRGAEGSVPVELAQPLLVDPELHQPD